MAISARALNRPYFENRENVGDYATASVENWMNVLSYWQFKSIAEHHNTKGILSYCNQAISALLPLFDKISS